MNGKKIADMVADFIPLDSPERAANFKRWFGKSKVVDDAGQPIVAYKAMPGNSWVDEQPITTIKRTTEFPAFNYGENGVDIAGFFARDPEIANRFTHMTKPEAPVYPVNLSFQKPHVIDAKGRPAGEVQFGGTGKPFRDAIRSGKFDSVIIKNTADEGDIYVSLDPTQSKSIFNRGTYDPNDPNILKAALPLAAAGGLMSALSPNDAEARIRAMDAPVEEAWNPVEAFAGGLGGGIKSAAMGVLPDGAMDWALNKFGGLMSGGK